jgi:hypothetical protein
VHGLHRSRPERAGRILLGVSLPALATIRVISQSNDASGDLPARPMGEGVGTPRIGSTASQIGTCLHPTDSTERRLGANRCVKFSKFVSKPMRKRRFALNRSRYRRFLRKNAVGASVEVEVGSRQIVVKKK